MPDRPITYWTVGHLNELAFDPVLREALSRPSLGQVKLPNGDGAAWLAARYADVTTATSDPRFSRAALLGRDFTRLAPHKVPLHDAVGFADPPEHTRLRRAAARAFSPRRIDQLRPRARHLAARLLDRMEAAGPPADLMEHLHTPFSLQVMSDMMGIPKADRPRLARWTELIISTAPGRQASERAKNEIGAYFDDLARRRLAEPQDDLLGHLANAEAAGELSRAEVVAFAVLLQTSGWHAVRFNSSSMSYVLLTRPELRERLRAEPQSLPQAVEELLRWIPHRNAVGMARIALEEVRLGGVTVAAGDMVHSSYLAANRDPAIFERPDDLDFDRWPNPHLSFGHGPHYCAGAPLARMEAQVLMQTLTDRYPGLRLAVPAQDVQWRRGELIRGPRALPVTW